LWKVDVTTEEPDQILLTTLALLDNLINFLQRLYAHGPLKLSDIVSLSSRGGEILWSIWRIAMNVGESAVNALRLALLGIIDTLVPKKPAK
jgi:hypothetical protein